MNVYQLGSIIAGRYEVVSYPMMGGMGIVYFCLDTKEDRPVALKTFRPEFLPDRAARERFLRESKTWVDLGIHPNIVSCYKIFYQDPTIYLVLELVAKEQGYENASLRSWLKIGKLMDLEQALSFSLQISRGMKHASTTIKGFVHRDLKPENILIGSDKLVDKKLNRLRITDFGLVAIAQSLIASSTETKGVIGSSLTHTHLTKGSVGTPLYMAPEQWRGESTGISTDVYAFGCILYEMLCGQYVAQGTTIDELRRVHCSGKLNPISISIPEDVAMLMRQCLATESSHRPDNWANIETVLETAYTKISRLPFPPTLTSTILDDRAQIGRSYNAIGESYRDFGKYREAIPFFEHSLSIAQGMNDQELESNSLSCLGNAYGCLGYSPQAIDYFEKSLAICRTIGDRYGEGAQLTNLGGIYINQGNFPASIKFNESALKISREVKNHLLECGSLNNLGCAYKELRKLQQAIEMFEQAAFIAQKINNHQEQCNALSNLGEIHRESGNWAVAIQYFLQALVITQNYGDRRREGVIMGNLAAAYYDQGDARQALNFLEQSLMISQEVGNQRGAAHNLYSMAIIHTHLGNIDLALSLAENSAQICLSIGDRASSDSTKLVTQLRQLKIKQNSSFLNQLFGKKK